MWTNRRQRSWSTEPREHCAHCLDPDCRGTVLSNRPCSHTQRGAGFLRGGAPTSTRKLCGPATNSAWACCDLVSTRTPTERRTFSVEHLTTFKFIWQNNWVWKFEEIQPERKARTAKPFAPWLLCKVCPERKVQNYFTNGWLWSLECEKDTALANLVAACMAVLYQWNFGRETKPLAARKPCCREFSLQTQVFEFARTNRNGFYNRKCPLSSSNNHSSIFSSSVSSNLIFQMKSLPISHRKIPGFGCDSSTHRWMWNGTRWLNHQWFSSRGNFPNLLLSENEAIHWKLAPVELVAFREFWDLSATC